jgi:hypothetical protein
VVKVRTSSVQQMQITMGKSLVMSHELEIDGNRVGLGLHSQDGSVIFLQKTREGWTIIEEETSSRAMGPTMRFLSSSGPIQVILPTNCASDITEHYLSVALRFTTDAYLYGRLDSIILYDNDVASNGDKDPLESSNILLLGGATINAVTRRMSSSQTLIDFLENSTQFRIQDRTFAEGSTLLAMFPHPHEGSQSNNKQRPIALLLHGTDPLAIERGYSLLPLRTGAMIPEWIVVDQSSAWKGYGGVSGAGWFNHQWGWSDAMSYLS